MIKTPQTLSRNPPGRDFQARDADAIGLLALGVVHDFKNVLTVIECALSLLGRRELDASNRQSLIAETSKSLGRGKQLAQRLLDMSRGEVLAGESICLIDLFSSLKPALVTTVGPLVDLHFDVPAGLPNIYADRMHLELIFLNLVINARDAMPDGGKICISTDLVQPCLSNSQASYLRTVIRDTGHGMDEKTLSHATDLFFTTKPAGNGTGLGLWQVSKFLSDIGGNFTLSSVQGEGTTAELWLPVPGNLLVRTPDSFGISQI